MKMYKFLSHMSHVTSVVSMTNCFLFMLTLSRPGSIKQWSGVSPSIQLSVLEKQTDRLSLPVSLSHVVPCVNV